MRGASPSARDNEGNTPLQYGETANNACLSILRDATAAIAAGKRYRGDKGSSVCTVM